MAKEEWGNMTIISLFSKGRLSTSIPWSRKKILRRSAWRPEGHFLILYRWCWPCLDVDLVLSSVGTLEMPFIMSWYGRKRLWEITHLRFIFFSCIFYFYLDDEQLAGPSDVNGGLASCDRCSGNWERVSCCQSVVNPFLFISYHWDGTLGVVLATKLDFSTNYVCHSRSKHVRHPYEGILISESFLYQILSFSIYILLHCDYNSFATITVFPKEMYWVINEDIIFISSRRHVQSWHMRLLPHE